MPVLELAEREVRRRQLIPKNLTIEWIPYDDKCDASYATISAMDGYGDCGHVLFGPTCDYSLGNTIFILIFVGGCSTKYFPHLAIARKQKNEHSMHHVTVWMSAHTWSRFSGCQSHCGSTLVHSPQTHVLTPHTHDAHNFSFIDHKLMNLCRVMESWAPCIVWRLTQCVTQQRQTTETRLHTFEAHTRMHTAINKELIRH